MTAPPSPEKRPCPDGESEDGFSEHGPGCIDRMREQAGLAPLRRPCPDGIAMCTEHEEPPTPPVGETGPERTPPLRPVAWDEELVQESRRCRGEGHACGGIILCPHCVRWLMDRERQRGVEAAAAIADGMDTYVAAAIRRALPLSPDATAQEKE